MVYAQDSSYNKAPKDQLEESKQEIKLDEHESINTDPVNNSGQEAVPLNNQYNDSPVRKSLLD